MNTRTNKILARVIIAFSVFLIVFIMEVSVFAESTRNISVDTQTYDEIKTLLEKATISQKNLEQAEMDKKTAEDAIQNDRDNLDIKIKNYENVRILYEVGAISKADFDKAENEKIAAENALHSAENNLDIKTQIYDNWKTLFEQGEILKDKLRSLYEQGEILENGTESSNPPTDTELSKSQMKDDQASPKTGDKSTIFLSVFVLITAAASIIILYKYRSSAAHKS